MQPVPVKRGRQLTRVAISLALTLGCAALGGCSPGSDLAAALGLVAAQPAAGPTPTATTPLIGDARKGIRIGNWRELLIKADGTIDAAEYRRVAANYNSAEIMDYRLGPTAADFAGSKPQATAPTLWGPDATGYGLWPIGTLPTNNPGEPEKCVRSENLPRSEQEEQQRGMVGAAWLVGGQHLFLPDNLNDPEYRYGISNTRGADGIVFDTGGLCMRMRASWEYDWWNRNSIAQANQPQVVNLSRRRPDLPLVPVAIARGRANASQVSFAAFKDGTIAPILVGNSVANNLFVDGIRLPIGMVPTAMAVTPLNEFLVVSVWDTNTVSGKLAFVALRGRQLACCGPGTGPDERNYWGLPNSWTIVGMKLLGFVDLPFAAPTSVEVSNNLRLFNTRGYGDNNDPAKGDLSLQSARDLWAGVNPISAPGDQVWHQAASAGYAVVSSRAENKVSFIDMTPLYQFYRDMYLTTQANYNRTLSQSLTDPAEWPFAFAAEPRQRPAIVTTLDVPQPTSVSTGVATPFDRSGDIFEYVQRSPKEGWSGVEPERLIGRSRAWVATMDGTVRVFNVQGLNLPGSPVGKAVPVEPVSTFQAGRNPRFAWIGGTYVPADDIWVVSRGDRRITFAWPTGRVQYSFTDSRLVDPVGGATSYNQAGYGGNGPGRAVNDSFITITDYNGKALLTYAFDARGGRNPEQFPFQTPNGPVNVLFGSVARFPGKPFMIDMEEII